MPQLRSARRGDRRASRFRETDREASMSMKILAAAALLFSMGVPASAQSGPSTSEHSRLTQSRQDGRDRPGDEAGASQERRGPTARQLNRREARYTTMRVRARAQYRRDRRAYMAAVMRKHRQSVSRYNYRYARREMAYANAMAAWRRQVSACKGGNRRACNAPSPRVADFY